MNLIEITKLIDSIDKSDYEPMAYYDQLALYRHKRDKLVIDINVQLASQGLDNYTLKELLLMSPEPGLAKTI